jgi:hypothetical protein
MTINHEIMEGRLIKFPSDELFRDELKSEREEINGAHDSAFPERETR